MWLIRGLRSTVGQKFLMGITGLLLCLFLVMHLAGNVLLYAGPGAYDAYAHALHKQEWLVKIAEAFLVVLFVLHIGLAVVTWRENNTSRPVGYEMRRSKQEHRVIIFAPSYWMVASGLIVLFFLIVHLGDFTWGLWHRPPHAEGEHVLPFDKALYIMKQPFSYWVYIIGTIFLGIHLSHGFGSAFRSLGWQHPKYSPFIWWFGVLFAVAIGVGFLSFPIWAGFYHVAPQ